MEMFLEILEILVLVFFLCFLCFFYIAWDRIWGSRVQLIINSQSKIRVNGELDVSDLFFSISLKIPIHSPIIVQIIPDSSLGVEPVVLKQEIQIG